MSKLKEMHYKEIAPSKTIEKLEDILSSAGIEVEENWSDNSEIDTSSVRVTIKGSNLGSNGKGVSYEFSKASAYAEFLERLQSVMLDGTQFLIKPSNDVQSVFLDGILRTAEEIVEENSILFQVICEDLGWSNSTQEEKIKNLKTYCRSERVNNRDSYISVPYFNITKKKEVLLPLQLLYMKTGSNGMCAGNSPEEAIIQGLSEIYERNSHLIVMREKLTLPDVPEAVIKQYPRVDKMYKMAKAIPGLKVYMKDASLGGKYPVAALITLTENTGNIGVKFGAHPDFGIAMERTLTETAQGIKVKDYSRIGVIDFNGEESQKEMNIENTFKIGRGYFSHKILCGEPSYPFTPVQDISDMSNPEILEVLLKNLEEDGLEVYVRNNSILGFPTYHIYIPGMSDTFRFDIMKLKAYNSCLYVGEYMNNPEMMTERACKLMIGAYSYMYGSIFENNMSFLLGYGYKHFVYGNELGDGCIYAKAMAHIYLGEYSLAYASMNHVVSRIELRGGSVDIKEENLNYYKGLCSYLKAMVDVRNHDKCIEIIRTFYDKNVADKIDDYFKNPKDVFVKQYTKHDHMHKKGSKDTTCCDYITLKNLNKILYKRQCKHPIKQSELEQYSTSF